MSDDNNPPIDASRDSPTGNGPIQKSESETSKHSKHDLSTNKDLPTCRLLDEKGGHADNNGVPSEHVDCQSAVKDGAASPKAPDGGWGWIIVLGSALTQIMFGVMIRAFGILYLELLKRFASSATAVGWIGAVNLACTGVFGPVATALCNRFSCRTVTVAGGLILFLGTIATGFAPNLPLVFVSYGVVAGFGSSLGSTPGFIMVGEYFDKRKSLAMALASFAEGLGAFAFPPLMIFWFSEYGFEGCFLILAALSLHCCVGGMLYRPLRPKQIRTVCKNIETEGHTEQESDTKITSTSDVYIKDPDSCSKESNKLTSAEMNKETVNCKKKKNYDKPQNKLFDVELLRDNRFMPLFFLFFTLIFLLACSSGFVVALAVEAGEPEDRAAFLVSISGICSTVGTLGIGMLLDVPVIRRYRAHIYAFLTFVCGISAIATPFAFNFAGFAAAQGVRSIAAGVLISQRATIIGDVVEKDRVTNAFGLLMLAVAFGSVAGRGLGGTLRDITGTYGTIFFISGCFTIFSSIIFLVVILTNKNLPNKQIKDKLTEEKEERTEKSKC